MSGVAAAGRRIELRRTEAMGRLKLVGILASEETDTDFSAVFWAKESEEPNLIHFGRVICARLACSCSHVGHSL